MRPHISGVAYDLDGTLYPNYRLNIRLLPFILKEWPLLLAFGKARNLIRADQEAAYFAAEAAAQEAAGQEAAAQEAAPDFYEAQSRLMGRLLRADPARIKAKAETLIYRNWEEHFKKIKLHPRVLETLESFRAAGLKQGILSDFPLERKLENLGLSGYWDAVLCSEHSGRLKPDPLPFEKLAEALGLPPEQILYVGNSRRCDIYGAKRAGMKTALIRFPPLASGAFRRFTDFVFHDYRQLRNYVLS
jgi:putative hydrolase of the HAD superfamily